MLKSCILALPLVLSMVRAQDVPPPPKPTDDGPSLEVTMKFVRDKVDGEGKVTYLITNHDSNTNITMRVVISEARSVTIADPASCALSFHDARTMTRGSEAPIEDTADYSLSLREVEKLAVLNYGDTVRELPARTGHPERSSELAPPPLFGLTVAMLTGKNGHLHQHFMGGGEHEQDLPRQMLFMSHDEDLVNHVAKAMVHAVELCGGGSKDPF